VIDGAVVAEGSGERTVAAFESATRIEVDLGFSGFSCFVLSVEAFFSCFFSFFFSSFFSCFAFSVEAFFSSFSLSFWIFFSSFSFSFCAFFSSFCLSFSSLESFGVEEEEEEDFFGFFAEEVEEEEGDAAADLGLAPKTEPKSRSFFCLGAEDERGFLEGEGLSLLTLREEEEEGDESETGVMRTS
jgi:hypothetical protein